MDEEEERDKVVISYGKGALPIHRSNNRGREREREEKRNT